MDKSVRIQFFFFNFAVEGKNFQETKKFIKWCSKNIRDLQEFLFIKFNSTLLNTIGHIRML